MKTFLHERNNYLDQIESHFGKPSIKIITGFKRVGKSVILRQLAERLKKNGAPENSILYIDKDSNSFQNISDHADLTKYILQRPSEKNKKRYLLVDGIDEIAEWDKALAACSEKGNMEIVITLPHLGLLPHGLKNSSPSGFVEIPIHSLDFSEFLSFRGEERLSKDKEFFNYIKFGGLPGIQLFDFQENMIYQYINSLYYTILLKDIIIPNSIRNISLLENIGKYVFIGVGSTFSAKSIADYLKTKGFKVGFETVQKYLDYFIEAKIIKRCSRYNIKEKRMLEIFDKFYVSDSGFRHSITGWRDGSIIAILENVVYHELLKKGFEVYAGKYGNHEIDFVALRSKEKYYIQVAHLLDTKSVIQKELRPLKAIDNNYPKTLISMDKHIGKDFDGIRHINIIDFCLGEFF